MSKDNLVEQKIRNRGPQWYSAAARTAVVAGVFCVIVTAVLTVTWAESRRADPATNAEMTELKARFAKDRSNDTLKREIRSLDLRLREAHTRSVDAFHQGAWLLLAGLAITFASARFAAAFRKTLPAAPEGHAPRDEQQSQARSARWSVTVIALLLASAGVVGALITAPPTPPVQETPGVRTEQPPALDPAKQWPRFRGPGGDGVSATTNIPTKWDGSTGDGILWKTPVPLPGQNSPVVWGDRVFLSGATKERREVYCFDAKHGKLVWKAAVENVPGTAFKSPRAEEAGHAAPTTATDGERVYAVFANGDLTAFDFDSDLAWARSLGQLDNGYGHASSLAVWRDLLIVQADQGPVLRKGDVSKSILFAFNGKTGNVEWQTNRHVPASWASPIVIRVEGRDLIVTCADPYVIAYDPATGKEVWRAKCLGGEIGPSPTYADGVVYATQEGASLAAIRANGAGDVTKSHIKWQADDNLPDTVSPLSNGALVFTVAGVNVACFDAADGRLLWEHDFDDTFRSSPSLVGDLVYLMDEKGVMHLFKAARSYVPVGTALLGEEANSSPAFLDDRIYIRGKKHLFCIGSADGGR